MSDVDNKGKSAQARFRLFNARELVPVILLILSLVVTYRLWDAARQNAEQALLAEFDSRVRELNGLIYERMQTYEQVLRGAVGFFSGSRTVDAGEFGAYVGALKLGEYYPGIQGIGFGKFITSAQKEKLVLAMRREGFPDYTITPAGERAVYAPVSYIQPFSARNQRAIGHDMYSDPESREAMDLARDTGEAAITNKLTLRQENGADVQPGFLMFLPVYRNDLPHDTIEARRANLLGWVYAPFRMNDLMLALHGEPRRDLDIEIYDRANLTDAARMYDTITEVDAPRAKTKLRRQDLIDVASHRWLVVTAAQPAFEQQWGGGDRAALILRGGISISLLLALLVWVFLDDRARAIEAANQAMQLALYDTLTGLPNRKLISERLTQVLALARRDQTQAALLFIDLDKFKPVNDEYGHAIGDLLLKEVGSRLQRCMRASDTAARLGGDEFVALLPEIEGRHGAEVAAEKILHALTTPFHIAGHTLDIAGSIGIALYPEHGADQAALIKSADQAMYAAKHAGRCTIRFAQA
ncbi:CHASE domain-containing protein [Noviherbaspirillum massiliense]|uniref:CHASE domain-containing protein n=1 Tax=Noviherbaspirillum massiliense TaxID=1465823 RepID=UPI00036CBC42